MPILLGFALASLLLKHINTVQKQGSVDSDHLIFSVESVKNRIFIIVSNEKIDFLYLYIFLYGDPIVFLQKLMLGELPDLSPKRLVLSPPLQTVCGLNFAWKSYPPGLAEPALRR